MSVGERQLEAAIFLRLAALGVTTYVSSGDAGSNPDASGHSRSPDSMVEYQASDPWVIAVGGTSLRLNPRDSSVVDEIAWIDSGGGVSVAMSRPAWQSPYSGAATQRLVPDVSSVGDPNPGAFVILGGKEWPVGGTSWSSPMWAGFSALIAEARERDGKPKLGFLAAKFYQVADKGGFRDIVKGSNGAFQAGPGWDPVTGLGVPNLKMP